MILMLLFKKEWRVLISILKLTVCPWLYWCFNLGQGGRFKSVSLVYDDFDVTSYRGVKHSNNYFIVNKGLRWYWCFY